MHLLLASVVATLLAQSGPPNSGTYEMAFTLPDGGTMRYGISVPKGYDPQRPVPLVLVLHSGGERRPHYGFAFMKLLAEPALGGLRPIMIAPDCPTNAWTDAMSEKAVVALVQDTLGRYAIDRHRILVTGFSMGGRGTWFMASRHADLFTAAIPMAASTGDEPIERLGTIPTYVIHSRADEVSPFAPAERTAKQLAAMGRSVHFEALDDYGHYEMFRYVDALRRAGRWVADQWGK